jgi:hypothetical protein
MSVVSDQGVHDRFWAKVDAEGDCWLWVGASSGIYGFFWDGQKQTQAHRAVWEMMVGPIPNGLHIDHLCKVNHCVNPDHLEPVTCAENLWRGQGPASKAYSRKRRNRTHCNYGHPYNEANTYHTPEGWRKCRRCDAKQSRVRKAQRKAPA